VKDTPLQGASNFSKIFSFGVLYPYCCTDAVKFGMEEWTKEVDLRSTPPCQISLSLVQRVTPAGQGWHFLAETGFCHIFTNT